MLKGKVVSYLTIKKYGFIKGDDGADYFFHFKNLLDKDAEKNLVKDAVVSFDPTPSTRGLVAKKVTIQKVFLRKELVDFFTTQKTKPMFGTVEISGFIRTPFYKNLSEAKNHMKKLAVELGCSAILNQQIEKTERQDGNYIFSMYACYGDLAIVTECFACDDEEIAIASQKEIDNILNSFNSRFNQVYMRERAARENQFKKDSSGCFFVFVVGLMLFFLLAR